MSQHGLPICLIDKASVKVAALEVQFEEDRYWGTISLGALPPALRSSFERFEEIVEGQVLSLLDEIEEEIDAYRLRVIFSDGSESRIKNLQVYPSTKTVSFVTLQPSGRAVTT